VSDSVLLRELPDGGHEFVLEDPVLQSLVIDGGVTLRFGRTDVVVRVPCALDVDGIGHRLDPRAPESLAPILSCHPGAARWVWSSVDGRLTVEWMQGQRLIVPELPGPCAWSVGRWSAPMRKT